MGLSVGGVVRLRLTSSPAGGSGGALKQAHMLFTALQSFFLRLHAALYANKLL